MLDLPVEFAWVLRSVLAAVFLWAGIAKVGNLATFREEALAYEVGPRPLVGLWATILPFGEFALAIALALGIALALTAGAAFVLIGLFAYASAVNVHRGRRVLCSCGFSSRDMTGAATLVRQAALGTAAVIVMITSPADGQIIPGGLTTPATFCLVAIVAAGVAGLALVHPAGELASLVFAALRARRQYPRTSMPRRRVSQQVTSS